MHFFAYTGYTKCYVWVHQVYQVHFFGYTKCYVGVHQVYQVYPFCVHWVHQVHFLCAQCAQRAQKALFLCTKSTMVVHNVHKESCLISFTRARLRQTSSQLPHNPPNDEPFSNLNVFFPGLPGGSLIPNPVGL